MRGRRILPIALGSFLVGIFSESYLGVSLSSWLLLLALAVAVTAFDLRKLFLPVFISCVMFTFGAMLMQAELSHWRALPETVHFDGVAEVITLEDPKVFYRPVVLTPLCEEHCLEERILFRAPLLFEAEPGDILHLACELKRPENFDPEFDYRSYLAGQGIGYLCEDDGESASLERPVYSWRRALALVRERVEVTLRQALPEPEAGLALGLTLGGNDYLDREMKDRFSRTGLSHIVAVSGFNMTILVQFALMIGLVVGLWRKHALVVSVIFILLFLLLIGAPASALRAALMTGAAFLAYFFGRLPTSINALLLAAALMTLGNPLLLRFDVGFQLSFLATAALIVGGPFLEMILPLGKWWAKILVVPLYTILIELFTLPVLFGTFGQASLLAPLTNFLVLPLVPVAMILTLFLLPPLFLLPALAPFLVFPLWILLTFQVRLTHWFSELPFGLIKYQDITLVEGGVWYTALALLIFFLSRFHHAYVFRMDH